MLFFGMIVGAFGLLPCPCRFPVIVADLDTGLVSRYPTVILITGVAIIAILCFLAGLVIMP